MQTLRKIKAATRHKVTSFGKTLKRLSDDSSDPYKIRYAYILVQLEKFAPFNLVSFVADGDYDEPGLETPMACYFVPKPLY